MAGFSKLFVVGGPGGFMGSDGVNQIEFMILVGDASRQWLEPHYFDTSIAPIGNLRTIVPAAPDQPDSLLDACIAFCPRYFSQCPSLEKVKSEVGTASVLDFDADPDGVPPSWGQLREEATPLFSDLSIWRADLTPIDMSQPGTRHETPGLSP